MPDETEKSGQRLCLFGGTFDPIHIAHLKIANEALRAYSLTKVFFVPAANPPHKQSFPVTSYEDRIRMCEIACRPYPPFEVSRLEAGPETTYTIDTLTKVRSELHPEDRLFFLIGADAFEEIRTWKRWEEVIGLTDFIVVRRPGSSYTAPDGAAVYPLDSVELLVSSSDIRARLTAGAETPEVPAEVREYIEQRGLYRQTNKETAAV